MNNELRNLIVRRKSGIPKHSNVLNDTQRCVIQECGSLWGGDAIVLSIEIGADPHGVTWLPLVVVLIHRTLHQKCKVAITRPHSLNTRCHLYKLNIIET